MAPFMLKFKGNKSFSPFAQVSDEQSLRKTWKVCTKVAAHLEQGSRLENLSWRLWYLHSATAAESSAKSRRTFKKLSKQTAEKLDRDRDRPVEHLTAPQLQRHERIVSGAKRTHPPHSEPHRYHAPHYTYPPQDSSPTSRYPPTTSEASAGAEHQNLISFDSLFSDFTPLAILGAVDYQPSHTFDFSDNLRFGASGVRPTFQIPIDSLYYDMSEQQADISTSQPSNRPEQEAQYHPEDTGMAQSRVWDAPSESTGATDTTDAGPFPSSHARQDTEAQGQVEFEYSEDQGGFQPVAQYDAFTGAAEDIPTGLAEAVASVSAAAAASAAASSSTSAEPASSSDPLVNANQSAPISTPKTGEKRKYRNPMATRPPAFTGVHEGPKQNTEVAPSCTNCGSTVTPLWRRGPEDELLCNACGLFYKLHQRHRPAGLAKPRVGTVLGDDAAPQRIECSNCAATQTPMWRKDPMGKLLCNACALYAKLHNAPRPPGTTQGGGKKRPRTNKNAPAPEALTIEAPESTGEAAQADASFETNLSTWTNGQTDAGEEQQAGGTANADVIHPDFRTGASGSGNMSQFDPALTGQGGSNNMFENAVAGDIYTEVQ